MKKKYKKWTKEEVDFVNKNYNIISYNKIAKQLDRSFSSVANWIKRNIEIKKNPKRISYNKDKIKINWSEIKNQTILLMKSKR